MAGIVLEYLDVMRFDRRTGRTPYELIHADGLGNLATCAPSNNEFKKATNRFALIEASHIALVPIDRR